MRFLIVLFVLLLSPYVSVSGESTEYRRNISSFSRIELTGRFNAVLEEPRQSGSISITAGSGSADDIETTVSGDKLIVSKSSGIYQPRNITVKITPAQLITELSASSGVLVKSYRNVFSAKSEIRADSGSTMELFTESSDLLINCGRNSKIKIKGKSENLEARASNGGEIDAFLLEASKCFAYSYTGSIIKVNISGHLEAGAGLESAVYYKGDPVSVYLSETLGGKYIKE
ncbi:MAG: DUF2807 domain-containing protein [Spirochaetales bacterium]|nr:DUF2807 domain-containing protein [Spirochaetales bacterium]